MRYREFVLSPYGVIKIKSLGYTFQRSDEIIDLDTLVAGLKLG
ncbi:hypothetical protein [Symbiopectobacterium purcellii]